MHGSDVIAAEGLVAEDHPLLELRPTCENYAPTSGGVHRGDDPQPSCILGRECTEGLVGDVCANCGDGFCPGRFGR
jgi:hypothetical protein